jgi:hypothetical protein
MGNKNCMKQMSPIGYVCQASSACIPTVCLNLILLGILMVCCMGATNFVKASPAAMTDNNKTPEQMEYEVKAAFIYNFMKFIHWPESKELSSNSVSKNEPIRIVISGDNLFKNAFQMIADKNIQGRPIQIVEIESFERFRQSYSSKKEALNAYAQTYLSDLQQYHMLFICNSEKDSVEDLLSLSAGKSVVTISDIEKFAQKTGMIGFVMEKQKVRFEVNLEAAQKENIQISSQLLGLARRVYKKEDKG